MCRRDKSVGGKITTKTFFLFITHTLLRRRKWGQDVNVRVVISRLNGERVGDKGIPPTSPIVKSICNLHSNYVWMQLVFCQLLCIVSQSGPKQILERYCNNRNFIISGVQPGKNIEKNLRIKSAELISSNWVIRIKAKKTPRTFSGICYQFIISNAPSVTLFFKTKMLVMLVWLRWSCFVRFLSWRFEWRTGSFETHIEFKSNPSKLGITTISCPLLGLTKMCVWLAAYG